ncbi:MAG: TonB-dependent receptor [Acidobacteria bacterium]|nr:TonB-dependent receptor [Acidobacteriota bacterium]
MRISAFLLVPLSLAAQADRAVLSGTITDASGASIAGARVAATSPNTGLRRETVSNSAGIYAIPGLSAGTYAVAVDREGFAAANFPSVTLTVGQRAVLNVPMQVAAAAAQVTIEAPAVQLDRANAEIGGVISGTQLASVPLNGRNWASFMLLAPGAVNTGEGNQNTIRYFGRSRDDNNFTFDGVDATGVKDPRQEANLRLNISLDAIAEFRVGSGLYTAESGSGAGGQMNLVSKSGTNVFHGGAFEFFRNEKLDARRPIDARKPAFRLNQFGANLGGPVRRDQIFFFANFEGLRQRLAQTFIGFVPSREFRARAAAPLRPVMSAYLPGTAPTTDPDIDQINTVGSQPWREDSGLVKIDYRLSPASSLFFRYNVDDGSINELRNALLETRTSLFRTQNGTVQFQHTVSPALFGEIKLGVNRSALHRSTNGTFAEGVSIPGFVNLQVDRSEAETGTSASLINNLSWIHGRHTLKFGSEYRWISLVVSDTGSVATAFSSRDNFLANRADSVSFAGALPSTGVRRPYVYGFAQDEVKLTPTVTATLGVRYEYYSVPRSTDGRGRVLDLAACGGFCAPGTPWYIADRNNFAPRAGLAWAPGGLNGRTVFRTGYGLFYGPGQADDVNAAVDSIPETLSLSVRNQPNLAFPASAFLGEARSGGAAPRSLQRDRREGYSQQWTLSVQQQLPFDIVGQASYVGSNGHHLFNRTFINVIDPSTGRRPYPAFSNIDEKQNQGNSSFNALQMSVNRTGRRLTWQTQYMWSHALNDNAGAGDGQNWMISNCRVCDRASADWDVRHTITATSIYRLPWGLDLSGLFTSRTGLPFNVNVNRGAADLPDGVAGTAGRSAPAQRPDVVAGRPLYSSVQTPDQWLNIAAFRAPARGTWGTLPRNALRGIGLWQMDLALGKQFAIREGLALSFRGELFNLANRPQYGVPNSNISNPAQFGRITSVVNNTPTGSGGPRQVQFMARLVF